ncbi:hypothetical protein OG352_06385 [Streptomyces sp. NBC_01485]|uniref:hypothetical protein n=1 Tax=Streptomyces sp. NBC_01485 TaxID=2903884 RepID=UPI002E35B7D1|nr:hypothetical protein [Streptomyces sp. NBC_01485]
MQLAQTSREYVRVSLTATGDNGNPVTATGPRLAFLAGNDNPGEDDWHDAETDDDGHARVLVGPDAIELDTGNYWVWITCTAGAEQPVERAGRLRIY